MKCMKVPAAGRDRHEEEQDQIFGFNLDKIKLSGRHFMDFMHFMVNTLHPVSSIGPRPRTSDLGLRTLEIGELQIANCKLRTSRTSDLLNPEP